jgi:hypothetical protein
LKAIISLLVAEFVMTNTAPAPALLVWALLLAGNTKLVANTAMNRKEVVLSICSSLIRPKLEREFKPEATKSSCPLGYESRINRRFGVRESFKTRAGLESFRR